MLVPSLVLPDAFCPGYENPLENTNTPALIEDEVLRGFAPLVRTQELLDYSAVAQSAPHEQVEMYGICLCTCACVFVHIHTYCSFAWLGVAGWVSVCFSGWVCIPSTVGSP